MNVVRCGCYAIYLSVSRYERDCLREAREPLLIHKAKTIEPLGMNKPDELYNHYIIFIFLWLIFLSSHTLPTHLNEIKTTIQKRNRNKTPGPDSIYRTLHSKILHFTNGTLIHIPRIYSINSPGRLFKVGAY